MGEEPRVHLAKKAPAPYQALAGFAKTVGAVAADAGIDDRLKEIVQVHISQLNGCAFCVRLHLERAMKAGVTADVVGQIATWRDSGVFTERERAGLELAEAFTFIAEDGISDEVYDHVGGVFSEGEYVALSWICISINAFNRLAIAGRYPVEPLESAAE